VDAQGKIFSFERDFAGSLQCIPMAVRLQLDLSGVKLSLKQWNKFSTAERLQLLNLSSGSYEQLPSFGSLLLALIDAHSHEPAVRLPVASRPAWEHAGRVPEQVIAWAEKVGVPAPSARQWRRLSPLQRFALLKLSLPGHDNDNFVPALREFGLLDS